MSHIKDTEYLALSARLHVLETRLLTRERMERMIEARDSAEAAKVLTECGYGELSEVSASALEGVLAQAQEALFRELEEALPAPGLLDVFRIKYDYHNAKALVKAQARSADPTPLLVGGGRFEPAALRDAFRKEDLRACPEAFQSAVARAREALASTDDPQLCDFILDRACYEELTAAARASESPFLMGYVRLLVDAANLRAAVRAARLGKDGDFLRQALLPGGNVAEEDIAGASGETLESLFHAGPLARAAEAGCALTAPGSGVLTRFEKLCDDAVTAYMSAARRVPFGEETPIGYLYARELELTAIRTIMNGRLAGQSGDVIRSRLREPYV